MYRAKANGRNGWARLEPEPDPWEQRYLRVRGTPPTDHGSDHHVGLEAHSFSPSASPTSVRYRSA